MKNGELEIVRSQEIVLYLLNYLHCQGKSISSFKGNKQLWRWVRRSVIAGGYFQLGFAR
jgi:hypothetical protein